MFYTIIYIFANTPIAFALVTVINDDNSDKQILMETNSLFRFTMGVYKISTKYSAF